MSQTNDKSSNGATTLVGEGPVNIEDPTSFNHCYAEVNHHTYHYVDQGPRDAPLIVLVHGFPESWYCWNHQIQYLSETLKFRVIAVDKPGYGGTKVGADLAGYSFKSTARDLRDLVQDVIGRQGGAIYMGRDWGSQLVWNMSLLYPDAVRAVIGLSAPFVPPQDHYVDLRTAATHAPFLRYQVALAEGDTTEFDQNLREFLECFWSLKYERIEDSLFFTPFDTSILTFCRQLNLKRIDFPPPKMMDYLVEQFKIQGTVGPTNWYRTKLINHNDLSKFTSDAKITQPSLLLSEQHEFITKFAAQSQRNFSDLTVQTIEGGHWINLTKPDVTHHAIRTWLEAKHLLP